MLPKRPALSPCFKQRNRGSALLITLTMCGIILITTASMLFSVRTMVRSTDDRLAYEECYHAALAGVASAKGWIYNPNYAKAHLGPTLGTKFQHITSGSIELAKDVVTKLTQQASQETLDNISTQYITNWWTDIDSSLGTGPLLPGGRRVLYDFTVTGDMLVKMRRDAPDMNTQSVYGGDNNDVRSYVSRIRITTPFRNADGFKADNLRQVTLIVEATATTRGVGRPKTRTVQQKLLIVPEEDSSPVLGPLSGVAFGGGAITVQGASSLNVRWAPVWCKGNMQLLQLALTKVLDGGGNFSHFLLTAGTGSSKFIGAGVTSDGMYEKWLRWQTAGVITDTNGNPTFAPLEAHSGKLVKDLFHQLMNTGQTVSTWNPNDGPEATNPQPANLPLPDITQNQFKLAGGYNWTATSGQWAHPGTGQGILFDPPNSSNIYGSAGDLKSAFVQKDSSMINKIDNLLDTQLNYTTWKEFAIQKGGYARPVLSNNGSVSYFVNQQGQRLYVTPNKTLTTSSSGNSAFTSIGQLSMYNLVPQGGSATPFNTSKISDRVLFSDTVQGTPNGTKATIETGSNFFWKGLLYLQANLKTTGVGAGQQVLMKNPDEFLQDPTGNTTGAPRGSCYLDGVVYVDGSLDRNGNGCIYGSLMCRGGYGGGGSPDIYYNSRNGRGLFQDVKDKKSIRAIIPGPIAEL